MLIDRLYPPHAPINRKCKKKMKKINFSLTFVFTLAPRCNNLLTISRRPASHAAINGDCSRLLNAFKRAIKHFQNFRKISKQFKFIFSPPNDNNNSTTSSLFLNTAKCNGVLPPLSEILTCAFASNYVKQKRNFLKFKW